MNFTKEQVLDALRHVEDPDLKKDLVSLGMIENIVIEGNKISFSVVLTTPACPLKAFIEQACRNAISHFISPTAEVSIQMTARVKTRNALHGNIQNIVLVSSGKGGVGKSTVSANLAVALAMSGAKVGLIDADIYGPSIPTIFDELGAKPLSIEGEGGKNKIVPIVKYGIKLLSLGFFAPHGQAVPWRGPMASSAVKQLFNDADWGDLDYLIVDLPPGTGDVHLTVCQNYPIAGAVIVTTPQQVAIEDTRKGMNMFKMQGMNVPILGIVENMSYFIPDDAPAKKYYLFGKEGGSRLSKEMGVEFLGELPLQPALGEASDKGVPLALQADHPMGQSFHQLAQRVAQLIAIQQSKSEQ